MNVRPVLSRTLLVAASVGAAMAPTTAHAIPPYVVSGAGSVSPGLGAPPSSFSFYGLATGVGGTYGCSFSGSSSLGGAGTMSGWCGPTAYASCTYSLNLTSWTFVCTNGSVGTFVVRPHNINPTTSFDATGTIS